MKSIEKSPAGRCTKGSSPSFAMSSGKNWIGVLGMVLLTGGHVSAQTTYTTLIMRTTLTDSPPTASLSAVNGMVFTDSRSVKKYWEDSSYGQATWTGTVIDVSIPYAMTAGFTPDTWANAAETAARAQGYEPNNYTAKVTMLGVGAQGGTGGYAVGHGGSSRVLVYDCRDLFTTAHELGHTISLAHSSTDSNNDGVIDSEYGDASSMMGSGAFRVNAPHAVQKGWLAPVTITSNGTYNVTPLENYNGVRVFKYNPPSGNPYFISYRQPLGFDALTTWYDGGGKSPIGAPFTSGVSIHRHNGSAQTLLIGTLGDGGTYSVPGTSVVITQNSHNSDYARFTITGLGGNATISGTHRIVSKHSSKAIDNGSTTLGAGSVQWDVNNVAGGGQQRWVFTQNPDTSWNIINEKTGLALEIQGTANNQQAKVWTYNGSTNQRWWVDAQSDGSYKIWNQWSGRALENLSSTTNGTAVVQWDWSGGNWQRWNLQ